MAENLKGPVPPNQPSEPSVSQESRCLDCGADLPSDPVFIRYRVCSVCRYHYYLSARDRIALLADAGTFHESNESLVPTDPLAFIDDVPYRERLVQAQGVTGLLEAVLTGTAQIGGTSAVLAVVDFGFMNGSIGSVAGEKITLAAELALQRRRPFVLVVSGGGSRMQEGALSTLQMAKVVLAVKRLSTAGVPFVSVLASPTTGQLYVGAGSMADVVFAEPGAIIGYAPLSAARQATRGALPKNFNTAEFHLQRGMIDRIVDRQTIKQQLALLLDLLGVRYRLTLAKRSKRRAIDPPQANAWERVQKARHRERPTSCDYIERITTNFVELHGDRISGDDPAIVAGVGYIAGVAVVVIGQERGRGEEAAKRHEGRIYPEGFRKAERVMRLAARFKLPVVTLIDTPGPYQGVEAEERGIGAAISSTMATMSDLKTPALSVIIGQGAGEAALAMAIADRTMMMENAIWTPVAPEAAAWILYRDLERADEVSASLRLTAEDCRVLGIIETVIAEPEGGAHNDFDGAARLLEQSLVESLLDLQMTFSRTLMRRRLRRFRSIGNYSNLIEATLASEAKHFPNLLRRRLQELTGRFRGAPRPRTGSGPDVRGEPDRIL
ncbi:MAG: acetyl-CoA carboxylase, carboxyl transferase, beta subunit [Dehalococcoidia bacterium]|nr:acetyl-CoA carboxylase, carboxyl transferase, beta subunit [Dehalococcoidia bacterium]